MTSPALSFVPAPPASPINPQFPPSDLRLMSWVPGEICYPENVRKWGGMKAVVQQLQENPGLFTGVMGFCGHAFAPNGTLYTQNATRLACCNGTLDGASLYAEARRQGMELQPVVTLDDPVAAAANPDPYIESFAAAAKLAGWSGLNIDWEGSPDPEGNLSNIIVYFRFMNAFADGLHRHGLRFSSDVQGVTHPWNYTPNAQLDAILGGSRATLVAMDTYYYSTGRVLDALDFYSQRVSPERLGIGMSTREPTPNYDGFVARFHALRSAGVREVDMFVMPLNVTWLPWLRKWKNGCRGCPYGGALSCW
eukprot:CAMPEP_0119306500 /NCGR_PEP_ID=MMETSP1333-20130426/7243_1 /TAXON_ID=418940 /ORGANISM="Scyphosphaera apsteinii, Strain RCC1455" /LENGTH=307 /DNA_ID=CAMNT_0007309817 /DNA_START=25 /DNA_END=945 /DNA_ORIENTATION=+